MFQFPVRRQRGYGPWSGRVSDIRKGLRMAPQNFRKEDCLKMVKNGKRLRNEVPSRFRKFRDDASIASVQRSLAKISGLPSGSVKIVYPSGRKVRTDSDVGKLKFYWNEK
jgi:hypothetical protein